MGFALFTAACIALLVLSGRDSYSNGFDMVQAFILPIITLMLGYYFGNSGKASAERRADIATAEAQTLRESIPELNQTLKDNDARMSPPSGKE